MPIFSKSTWGVDRINSFTNTKSGLTTRRKSVLLRLTTRLLTHSFTYTNDGQTQVQMLSIVILLMELYRDSSYHMWHTYSKEYRFTSGNRQISRYACIASPVLFTSQMAGKNDSGIRRSPLNPRHDDISDVSSLKPCTDWMQS